MKINSLIESVLFIAGKNGLTIEEITKLVECDQELVVNSLSEMSNEYENNEDRGIVLKKFGNNYKLVTKQSNNLILNKSFNIKSKNVLNNSLLEILAIIAYNEPCTRATIYDLRKVDPTPQLNKLLEYGLIQEVGRSEGVGKVYLYQVTKLFYDTFGISSINDLPEIVLPEEQEEDLDFFDSNRYE